MSELISEIGTEILGIILSGIGAIVFSVGGILAEQAGFQNLLAGHAVLGVWETAAGFLLLFAGLYMLGYKGFWIRLQTLSQRGS